MRQDLYRKLSFELSFLCMIARNERPQFFLCLKPRMAGMTVTVISDSRINKQKRLVHNALLFTCEVLSALPPPEANGPFAVTL